MSRTRRNGKTVSGRLQKTESALNEKLNIAERFELAVPCSAPVTAPCPDPDEGFPEPIAKSKVLPCAAGHSNKEQGILNYPTHHRANLTALCALYRNTNPTGVLI